MDYCLLGWPEDEPTLRLDYRTFSYAGKFVMSNTGKAVVRDPDADADADGTATVPTDDAAAVDPSVFESDVRAAIAFNEDRTDPGVLWLRYVTVHEDYRGQGLGPKLAAFVAEEAEKRGYRRLRIAVNNPFAYQAMYKVGFAYTGRQTGLAELVLERPGEPDRPTYQCGLDVFRQRDLADAEHDFLDAKEGVEPPAIGDGREARVADDRETRPADDYESHVADDCEARVDDVSEVGGHDDSGN
jgi:GNAT superfamily N-acetyltransferase